MKDPFYKTSKASCVYFFFPSQAINKDFLKGSNCKVTVMFILLDTSVCPIVADFNSEEAELNNRCTFPTLLVKVCAAAQKEGN